MDKTMLRSRPFCGEFPRLIFVGGNINKWVVCCDSPKCRIQPSTDYHKFKAVVTREWNRRKG